MPRDKGTQKALYYGPEPKIGTPATVHYPADSYPATVVEILRTKDKTRWDKSTYPPRKVTFPGHITAVIIQRDKSEIISGSTMSEDQEWSYTTDPEATKETYTLRRNGQFVQKDSHTHNGLVLTLGIRRRHSSPCI